MMNRNMLSITTSIVLLAGCSIAHEPGTEVKADQADVKSDARQQLPQENTIARVQSTTQVVADTPPSEQGVAEPVTETHTTVSGDPQENAVSPRAQVTTRVVADTPPSEQGVAEPVTETQTTAAGEPHEKAKRREKMIRGVVARALADIPPENDPPRNMLPKSENPPPDRQQSRREQLQDVMANARPSKASPGNAYIAELNEEVSTTVVINEEGARLPAVTAPPARSDRSVPKPVSNEDFLVYTVQSGDSLWAIAEYFYGDGFRYTDIFKANRDLIEHTNLLEIGQPLRIPRHGTIRRRSTF